MKRCLWFLVATLIVANFLYLFEKDTDNVIIIMINALLGLACISICVHLFGRVRDVDVNPVLYNGLSNNPEIAKNEINNFLDNEMVIIKIEKGKIVGPPSTRVKMRFSDGDFKVNLVSGDYVYRVTEDDMGFSYFRQKGANLIMPFLDNWHQLPFGWKFEPSGESWIKS